METTTQTLTADTEATVAVVKRPYCPPVGGLTFGLREHEYDALRERWEEARKHADPKGPRLTMSRFIHQIVMEAMDDDAWKAGLRASIGTAEYIRDLYVNSKGDAAKQREAFHFTEETVGVGRYRAHKGARLARERHVRTRFEPGELLVLKARAAALDISPGELVRRLLSARPQVLMINHSYSFARHWRAARYVYRELGLDWNVEGDN